MILVPSTLGSKLVPGGNNSKLAIRPLESAVKVIMGFSHLL
jgi:hypothetical protein